MIDLDRASAFMLTHARLIDRRRFELLFRGGGAGGALSALAGYANADGGFGWALEPDLRGAASQPVGALHALEVFEEAAPVASTMAERLCDWLEAASLPEGGLPFAVAGAGAPGDAPHWAGADPSRPSLHITGALCAAAHRVAAHDPAVAGHAWLAQTTEWCLARIASMEEPGGAYELHFVLELLDTLHDGEHRAAAAAELERLGAFLPEDGRLPVAGGAEGEALSPLHISPLPGRPLRELLPASMVEADLDRLAAEQHDDGGWDVDWRTFSPAAALEWRGYITVRALKTLRANGRLDSQRVTRPRCGPAAPA